MTNSFVSLATCTGRLPLNQRACRTVFYWNAFWVSSYLACVLLSINTRKKRTGLLFRASVQSTWQNWMLLVLMQKMRIHAHLGSSESRARKQNLCSDIGSGCRYQICSQRNIEGYIEGRFARPGAPALKTSQKQKKNSAGYLSISVLLCTCLFWFIFTKQNWISIAITAAALGILVTFPYCPLNRITTAL